MLLALYTRYDIVATVGTMVMKNLLNAHFVSKVWAWASIWLSIALLHQFILIELVECIINLHLLLNLIQMMKFITWASCINWCNWLRLVLRSIIVKFQCFLDSVDLFILLYRDHWQHGLISLWWWSRGVVKSVGVASWLHCFSHRSDKLLLSSMVFAF